MLILIGKPNLQIQQAFAVHAISGLITKQFIR